MYHEDGMYLPYSRLMKEHLTVPVMTAGRMDDPDLASAAIREGKTDLIGLARPLLADPYLPRKVKEEKIEDIRPCLSCHEGCLKRMHTLVSCAVNPSTGRESELRLEKADTIKKVIIAGGGIAGIEAARVCALRGHNVIVYEKNSSIGGNIIPGGAPDFKHHDGKLLRWYEHQLDKLGVDVRKDTIATKQAIEDENPDVLVFATGSKPILLKFPGSDNENVVTASDALLGNVEVGDEVLIVGGGLVGCETALWLAKQGKKVTIVEMLSDIMYSGEPFVIDPNETMLRGLIDHHNITKKTSAKLSSYSGRSAAIKANDGGEENIPADTVIIAAGYAPNAQLAEEFKYCAYETYSLGDCKSVRDVMRSIWEAYEVARFV